MDNIKKQNLCAASTDKPLRAGDDKVVTKAPIVPGVGAYGCVYGYENAPRMATTGSSSNTQKDFESLLGDVSEYWEKRKGIGFPAELDISQGCDYFSYFTALIKKISGAAITFSVVAFVQNPEAFGVSSDSISLKKIFQGSSGKLAVQIVVGVFITACILCFVCVVIDNLRKNKDRRTISEFLSKLYEEQKIYSVYRPLIDSETLSVHRQLKQKCKSLDARIHYLETNDLECSPLMDIVKKIQVDHEESLSAIKYMISEDFAKVNQDIEALARTTMQKIDSAEENMCDKAKELEEKVKTHEECIAGTMEEISRCIELNTDTIRNILQRGLESATKKAEEVKEMITHLNSDISSILKDSIHETEHALEQIIQVRRECMRVLSCMFVEKKSAAAAACCVLLEAHSQMKEVSLLHACHSYDGMKKRLEYRVPGKVAGFFYDTFTVNETIAAVHVVLTKELFPILENAEDLRVELSDGQVCSQIGDTCISIIKRCDEKLFGDSGVLTHRVFVGFLKKLSELVHEECTTGSGQDALEKIKKSIPFFMVVPHVIKIALGIEGMHLAADEICSISESLGGKFADVFPFFPKEHVLTSRLSGTEISSLATNAQGCNTPT
ncbi:MAG: hypothetical protein AB8U44_00375 [Aaplasma endosymbiont of Hyalomma asiaticum]